MIRRGWTKDAWPCCGAAPDTIRPKGVLCPECTSLIKDGRQFRAQRETQDTRVYLWSDRHYGWPGFIGCRELATKFFELVQLIVEPTQERLEWVELPTRGLVSDAGRERSSRHDCWQFHTFVRTRPAVREALSALHAGMVEALRDAEERGLDRGSSLLQQLATGAITVETFDSDRQARRETR